MTGITSYGAYIPRLRLQRKAIAQANAWFAPGLMGAAKGERSMANWDEDAVTMAVEAARDCLPAQDPIQDRAFVDGLYFASTTMPFSDRQNAGIIAGALSLKEASLPSIFRHRNAPEHPRCSQRSMALPRAV
jgi:3-hydroxy-3-methylglutaryl CoA synthase